MDLGLKNDVAVIVGGAKGIGRAIANAFGEEGARVALVDVDDLVGNAADEIKQEFSGSAIGITADATDLTVVERTAARIADGIGPANHVIYAAGAGSRKYGFPFWNLQPSDWPRVIEVNLLGAVNVAHAFAPRLAEQRRGTMLFLSSVAGQIGSQTDPPYSAAKAALINFAQCAAKDLAQYDVRVNTICPGMVKTDLNQSVWQSWNEQQADDQKIPYDEWAEEKIRRLTPLGRWQTPEDIASLAVFLASPQAKNITGQTLNVDGGWVMHW